MRSVVASLACLLFLVGCHTSSAEPHSRHEGSNSHSTPDAAAVEPFEDAAEPPPPDADLPDASVDIEIDASMMHVSDPEVPRTPTDPPFSKPNASTPPTPIDAGVTDPPIDAGADPAIDAGDPDVDATTPVDSGTDDSGPVDSGTELDAGTDAEIDAGSDAATDSGNEPEDAATDAGPDADVDAATPTCSGPPGMYKDDYCQVLSDGIRVYKPQYPLWSDGATKERYIFLPAGKQINTSNPNRWTFPQGTRLYKTFSWDGLRVETRVLVKTAADNTAGFTGWTLTSYAWSADQNSATPASTSGVANALGSPLDIPSQSQCTQCHSMSGADAPIGFNAIQLNHDLGGVTLGTLLDEYLLKNGTSGAALNVSHENSVIPGDDTAKAALGYLHGNCGHCHGGPSPRAGQALWSTVGLTDLSDAPIFQTAVCRCLQNWKGRTNADDEPYKLRVAPSHEALSGIVGRMSRRGAGEQMPPVGTKVTDPTGLATVRAWINSLDGSECEESAPVCQ
jgi:hypothetical protein